MLKPNQECLTRVSHLAQIRSIYYWRSHPKFALMLNLTMKPKVTESFMPLTELVSLLKELSYSEKLLLLHFLVTELLKDSGLSPLSAQDHDRVASQGLYDSFEAAAVLAKALAEEEVATYGR
ncbi:MAG: hypothetical protein NW224_03460 [Leptolyngbyaceae cyanobacterium bins.302]|nr:hypothetical protein [Leptolyngbyaceae cyanobacterium bins.302]